MPTYKNTLVRVVVVLVLILSCTHLFSLTSRQQEEFSEDNATFVSQMSELFMASADKKRAEAITVELQQFVNTADQGLVQNMIATCNSMRRLRAKPFPDYQNCIKMYMDIDASQNLRGANLTVWEKSLQSRLEKRVTMTQLNNFMKFTSAWVNDGALYMSNSVKWVVMNPSSACFEADGNDFKIAVPETTIRCFAQGDSIEVIQTSGVFTTKDNKWRGDHGTITWERVNLPSNEVNAKFGAYEIDMKTNNVSVPQVQFLNTNYFKEALEGSVEYKCVSRKTTNGAKYPKFETLGGGRMDVKEMFPNVSYNGGFTQVGANFIGTGSVWMPAEITIHHGDTVMATFTSTSFMMSLDQIESAKAGVSINLLRDKVTHPGLRFRFKQSNRTIELTRGNTGVEQSTYQDSYHKVNMDVELMKWNIDGSKIYLTMLSGAAHNTAYFESQSYYHDDYFNKLWGMNNVHPFQQIADFVRYNGGGGFSPRDFAQFVHMPLGDVQKMLLALSYNGFVDYYVEREVCNANQRLYDYLQFNLGKKDYDVLRFLSIDSTAKSPNGYIDLNTMDMHLNKVPGVIVSEVKNVNLIPDSGQIILKRNRDFEFNGVVTVGLVTVKGKDFYFSYDDYQLRLDSIEEMKMLSVDSANLDRYGQPSKVGVGNVLNDLSGLIQIDDPGNKSGKMNTVGYPRLNSTRPAKIYYDDPRIQNGQYSRETFYFTVDTFTFDDINNITNSNLPFHGVLTTGIFPDIEHDLEIRGRDHSLGFTQASPEDGFPIYGDKARFFNIVDLSNEGLKGIGRIEYLTSKSESKEAFLFLPDHVEGTTSQFDVEKVDKGSPTYPGVELGRNQSTRDANNFEVPGQSWLEFYPQEDHLDVKNTLGKFHMFPTQRSETGFECEMDGMLRVTPTGLKGLGRATLEASALESGVMKFTDHTISADTSYFASYTIENEQQVLQSGELRRDIVAKKDRHVYNKVKSSIRRKYYNDAIQEDTIIARIMREERSIAREINRRSQSSFIDFDKREGYFSFMADEGNEKEFATIKYKTMVKNYTWNIDKNAETIGQKGSEGNRFVCTKERGDSLNFLVPVATFDRNTNTLRCEDVDFIDVADARVHINKGDLVTIRKNAVMDPFDKVKVDVGNDSIKHYITNAHIQIEGAKKYKGHGNYDFVDNTNGHNNVYFGEIVTDDGETVAKGTVSDPMPFDEHFMFKGDVELRGGRQLLEFDGGAKMIHSAAHGPRNYVRFKSIIDPHSVRIPIEARTFKTTQGKGKSKADETYRAFYIRKDSIHIYSTFLEQRKDVSDVVMAHPEDGLLLYSGALGGFTLISQEKLDSLDKPGSYMVFDPEKDRIRSFGPVDLQVFLNKRGNSDMDIRTSGDMYHDRSTNTITTDLLMNMDFFLGSEVTTLLYKDILTSSAPKCDTAPYHYTSRLKELYDPMSLVAIKEASRNYYDYNVAPLPADGPVFTFDKFQMTWSTEKRSYVCDTTVNLMMMKYCKVCRKVKIQAEFLLKKNKGSRIKMLLSMDGGKWYFFDYRLKDGYNTTSVLSSNPDLALAIEEKQAKLRRDRSRDAMYQVAPQEYLDYFKENFGLNHIPADPYGEYKEGGKQEQEEEETVEEEVVEEEPEQEAEESTETEQQDEGEAKEGEEPSANPEEQPAEP